MSLKVWCIVQIFNLKHVCLSLFDSKISFMLRNIVILIYSIGSLTCRADESLGNTNSTTTSIRVYEVPQIHISPVSSTVEPNASMTFTCDMENVDDIDPSILLNSSSFFWCINGKYH